MADKLTSVQEVKFSFKFADEDDAAQWITFPNPKPTMADIKSGLSSIENLAVNNNLLIGKSFKSNVVEMNDVKVIYKTETSLDWRS